MSIKRIISGMLALVLMLGCVPVTVRAKELPLVLEEEVMETTAPETDIPETTMAEVTEPAEVPEEILIEPVIVTEETALASTCVSINKTNFPDEVFRTYVSDYIDLDWDGVLSIEEIASTKWIDVSGKGIQSLKGIECFINLEYLYCYNNQLAKLDVSKNIALTRLDCGANHLTELDVSRNTALTYLQCHANRLTELDVSRNIFLEYLLCSENRLTQLNLQNNFSLKSLGCGNNPIVSLNVRCSPALEDLWCGQTHLTSLDLSNNTMLQDFSCTYNHYILNFGNNNSYDFSTLPGNFDISKASNWLGGSVKGSILTVDDGAETVTYTYDCGNSKTMSVELLVRRTPVLKAVTNRASDGKPTLTWDSMDNAESYQIWRSKTGKAGSFGLINTVTTLTATNYSAIAGTKYYYKIRSVYNDGTKSNYSNVISVTCDLPRPTGLKVTNNAATGKNVLSWNAVAGAAKYQVYYSTTGKTGSYQFLVTTKNLTHTHAKAAAGTKYYYKVKAIHTNTAANSAFSVSYQRTCDLPRPTGIKVTNNADTGKNVISWNKVHSASKYQVWYSKTGKTGSFSLLMTTKNLTHTHKNGTVGTKYYYKVKAIHSNVNANSAFSIIGESPLPNVTVSVSNVTATGKIQLTWNAVADAQKYQVWYSTSKDGTYTLLKTTTQTSHIHAAAKAGQTYYYKVREVYSNTDIAAPFSEIVSCVCDLAQPVATIAHDDAASEKYGYDVMCLSWNDVGASKYILYYYSNGWKKFHETTATTVLIQENNLSYKVQAIHSNAAANSAMSNIASLSTQTAAAAIQIAPQNTAWTAPIVISE